MNSIKISDIIITIRQRKAMDSPEYLEHVISLANSIKKFGLLSPIVLDTDNTLIAGFTRIQAHFHLGLEEIEYIHRDGVSDVQRKEMEFAENKERMDLEWWEEAAAIAEIHAMKQKDNPNWTMSQTGALVGAVTAKVSQSVDLNKASKEDPTILTEKTLTSALKKRKNDKQLASRKIIIADRKKEGKVLPAEVIVGDALELILKLPDNSFDAVITNFPFGIDLTFKGGKQVYEDEEMAISDLVYGVVQECHRVLKDDSWFVGFFDIRKITHSNIQRELHKHLIPIIATMRAADNLDQEMFNYISFLMNASLGLTGWLEDAGFSYVNKLPAIWVKPNKTAGMLGDPRRGLISSYEAMIFAAKGNAILMRQGRQNVFVADTPLTSERLHSVQMPVDICSELVSMVCLGGGRILDPFAGSGSIGIGALENQCEFLGFELNHEFASNANLRLKEHIFTEETKDNE